MKNIKKIGIIFVVFIILVLVQNNIAYAYTYDELNNKIKVASSSTTTLEEFLNNNDTVFNYVINDVVIPRMNMDGGTYIETLNLVEAIYLRSNRYRWQDDMGRRCYRNTNERTECNVLRLSRCESYRII